jgi:exosome complex component RRP42
MANNIVSRLKRKKILEVVSTGNRMDGRALMDYRDFVIKKKPLEKAEGSAEIWLGKTHVIVGVKAGIGKPFEDRPDEGVLIVNAEFTPIAHSTWEPGPPNESSIELARVVDRGMRSAEIIDMKKLCVRSGQDVYVIFVDLYVLNYDGNLIDACAIGAISALEDAKIPVFKVTNGVISQTNKTKKLELKSKPIAVTFVIIGDNLIIDPTEDEEEVMDARLTVTINENGNVTTLQKSGSTGISLETIQLAINTAVEKTPKLRTMAIE